MDEPSAFNPAPGNIIFSIDGGAVGATEVLRLDAEGMTYKGQRIEDAGEAHRAWLEVMAMMKERG